MSKILVTPSELRASSSKFKQCAEQIAELMRNLDSELNKLNASWDGAAQDKLFQNWNAQGKKGFEQIQKECIQFSDKVNDVANRMEQLDQELAKNMNIDI